LEFTSLQTKREDRPVISLSSSVIEGPRGADVWNRRLDQTFGSNVWIKLKALQTDITSCYWLTPYWNKDKGAVKISGIGSLMQTSAKSRELSTTMARVLNLSVRPSYKRNIRKTSSSIDR